MFSGFCRIGIAATLAASRASEGAGVTSLKKNDHYDLESSEMRIFRDTKGRKGFEQDTKRDGKSFLNIYFI